MRKSLKVLLAVVALVSTSCSGQPSSEQSSNKKNEYEPKIYESSGKILYGLYPQTVVNDITTIMELDNLTTAESNGWYLYEDTYYVKQVADPYGESYTFNNGVKIIDGNTYWFKCEPIVWRILANDNGEYFVLSEMLIDAHCYHSSRNERTIYGKTIYANNYEHSDIRAWLNNDFYNSAFSLNDEHISVTEVDNSCSSTKFASDNTFDKVFLLSYQDYNNSDYGFDPFNDEDRQAKTTDYARARGAYYSSNNYYYDNGEYWTRTPCSRWDFTDYAFNITPTGDIDDFDGHVVSKRFCVRPAITLFIS